MRLRGRWPRCCEPNEATRLVRSGRLPVNGAVESGRKETSVLDCDSRPRLQATDVVRTGSAVTIDARQLSTRYARIQDSRADRSSRAELDSPMERIGPDSMRGLTHVTKHRCCTRCGETAGHQRQRLSGAATTAVPRATSTGCPSRSRESRHGERGGVTTVPRNPGSGSSTRPPRSRIRRPQRHSAVVAGECSVRHRMLAEQDGARPKPCQTGGWEPCG